MSATVNISELPPDVQARVLKQIGQTEPTSHEPMRMLRKRNTQVLRCPSCGIYLRLPADYPKRNMNVICHGDYKFNGFHGLCTLLENCETIDNDNSWDEQGCLRWTPLREAQSRLREQKPKPEVPTTCTALAVVPEVGGVRFPQYTEAENLARKVLARMDSVAAKLRDLETDIRNLWAEFDKLKTGETILGCATKKEFCEKKLHRTPRAVQYLLSGRPSQGIEQSSPMQNVRQLLESAQVVAKVNFKTDENCFEDGFNEIPELVDTCKFVERVVKDARNRALPLNQQQS